MKIVIEVGHGGNYSNVTDYYDSDKVKTILPPLSVARDGVTSTELAGGVIMSGGATRLATVGIANDVTDFYPAGSVLPTT